MRCFKIVLFLVVLSLTNLSFSNAASIVLESTFDNDDEGWGIRSVGTNFTYHASGGNPYPGGFISAEDQGLVESWFFVSPDTWAGDWTSYIGGIISFDLKLISGDTNKYFSAGDVIIETAELGHFAQWFSGIDPGLGTWTHYEVRISESNFEIVGNSTWNEILSNVTNLVIRGEHILLGPDTEGIDNIRVVDSLSIPINLNTDGDGVPNDEDECPESNLSETVVIDGWDFGVDNVLLEDGCTISDLIYQCAEDADNHGEFVSCVSHTTNHLKTREIISGKEKGMIQKCAAKADIP
jgi:hypothetical protein